MYINLGPATSNAVTNPTCKSVIRLVKRKGDKTERRVRYPVVLLGYKGELGEDLLLKSVLTRVKTINSTQLLLNKLEIFNPPVLTKSVLTLGFPKLYLNLLHSLV